jgi:hypothetical protein
LAKEAYDTALLAGNQSESMVQERADLVEKLDEFHSMAGATPAEIRNLALEVSYSIGHGSIFSKVRVWIMMAHFINTLTRTILGIYYFYL